eukprot:TRINITY_DN23134_c0_g1_i14.p1 TRINITY_DN23134_c0_g1~~TRINITY_DN23134_c0_g1_i14.p1  ORF type:complete len:677 (-),score=207.88 TRINITY_DN23134_c0_g1_i14:108-2138(-)
MTSRDKSTERQFSLDSAFSSLSSELCHKMMTSSFPSYDFKTPEIFTTSPKIDPTTFIYNPGPVKSSRRRPVIQNLNIPLLSHLEPHNTGFLSPQCLVHYWEGLGVEDGSQVLEDLGLSADEERLDLRIVSQKLNDEIGQALEIVSYASVQAAIATLYDEVVIVKNALDNVAKERDKFRSDIQEAQKRAEVLAMEMDEQNYQHDKLKQEELQDLRHTWVERLQSVEEKLKSESETHETEIQGIQRKFNEEKTNFEDLHRRMEKEFNTLIEKNKKLEDELESKNEKMAEMEEVNSCLRKKMEKPGHLLRIESCQETDSTQDLIYNVEELVRVNKDLKDRNEELEIKILVNSFTDCLPNSLQENKMKRKGCLLPESPPSSSKSKMTKKNTEKALETAPSETKYSTDLCESENDEDEVVSSSDIWFCFDQKYKIPSLNISKPCKTLEDELDHVSLDDLEEKFKELKKDEDSETNRLLENNKHLEESLEMMQTEFESMEDYWQKKIDEERIFYEDQLKVSEDQFKELEVRMKEYEELLTNMESSKHEDSDRLYAIDEQRSLEESVNEWEEEISQLKLQLEEIEMNHEEDILALKGEIFVLTRNNHSPRNLDTFNNASYRKCLDFSSLKEKRRNLELSWTRAVELCSDDNRHLLMDTTIEQLMTDKEKLSEQINRTKRKWQP